MLVAFQNTTITKPAILKQLRAHAKTDEIVKGYYWRDGKGCAVGCTIYSGDYLEYETRFGIPQMLARLEDCIFEGLPNDKEKEWPIRFMSAIRPGSDLSRVGWQFLYWVLTDEKINPGINHPLVRDAVKQCADVLLPLTKNLPVNTVAAESAAESAKSAALSAALSAAESAYSAALSAKNAAWSAAESAERTAESAAWSASSAAWSARSAAESADSAAYVRMSDKLILLIKSAPKAKREKKAA